MANVINYYPEAMDKRTQYKLMNAQNAQKMSAAAGSVLTPENWIIYEDADVKTGEVRKVLAVEASGEIFATVSKTFIEKFENAVDFFGADLGQIEVIQGVTKSGREYITCGIV